MLRKKILENECRMTNKQKKLKTDETQHEPLDLSLNYRSTDVSEYFVTIPRNEVQMTIENMILELQLKLNEDLRSINFIKPPIEYVYNPLEYAFEPNEIFVRRYCTSPKKILFIGMNPGPFGMCQTGIPFGDPKWVRDWLEIYGEVNKPSVECPERKVLGFLSQRKEQSGNRFWGLFCKLCGSPENFFKHCFVSNFCPLAFMKSNGSNITPREIKNIQDRKSLESICDAFYLDLVRLLNPEIIVAIGEYMEKRTKELCKHNDVNVRIIRMPHPSPRAVNNQNWPEKAETLLHNKTNSPPISEMEHTFMERAFFYAKQALAQQEVPVGCIFVFNGNIVGLGRNTVNETHNATRHAEMNCIDQVTEYCKLNNLDLNDVFSEICVYVTVEPCIMCSVALYELKVKSVIFGCKNDRFGGQSVFDVSKVLNPVTVVKGGYRAEEAMHLLKEFYKGTNPSAPPSKVKVKGKKK